MGKRLFIAKLRTLCPAKIILAYYQLEHRTERVCSSLCIYSEREREKKKERKIVQRSDNRIESKAPKYQQKQLWMRNKKTHMNSEH